jgi:hypothetical protein
MSDSFKYDVVANLLELPINDDGKPKYWKIVDTLNETKEGGPLYLMVSYDKTLLKEAMNDNSLSLKQKDQLLSVRSVIINYTANRTVCPCFVYTPTVIADGILNIDEDIEMIDVNGILVAFHPSKVSYTLNSEGTMLRWWYDEGKVRCSTLNKIDASRSRWINTGTFPELYTELGGPSAGELFDLTKKSSPAVHTFIVSHSQLANASKAPLGLGHLMYVGNLGEEDGWWNPEFVTGPYTVVPGISAGGTMSESEDLKVVSLVPPPTSEGDELSVYLPYHFNATALANQVLRYGYSGYNFEQELITQDPRFLPGEPIIIHLGKNRLIKVLPTPYVWRNEVIGNNPNLYNRFLELVGKAQKTTGEQREDIGEFDPRASPEDRSYRSLFPPLLVPESNAVVKAEHKDDNDPLTLEQLGDQADDYPLYQPLSNPLTLKQSQNFIHDMNYSIRLACYTLALAVPIQWQSQILGSALEDIPSYSQKYYNDRQQVIFEMSKEFEVLLEMVKSETLAKDERFRGSTRAGGGRQKLNLAGKSVTRLITQADKYFKNPAARKINNAHRRRENLKNLLMREFGESLYALIKAFVYYKDRQKAVGEEKAD